MPTYTYRREDGSTFEVEQRITEDPLETCPTTGQSVKRIITSGAGLVFKGSGFYLTDYSRGSSSTSADTSPADAAAPADGDKPAGKAAETTSEGSKASDTKGKDAPKASSTGPASE